MNPIDTLIAEHTLIRQYLNAMIYAREQLERGGTPPKEFFEQAVFFAREFVDRYHHLKEEHQMFELLAQKSGGDFDAPLAALRAQHEHGRNHVAHIREAIEGYVEGDEARLTDLVEALAAYTAMLTLHINREDHVFFSLARASLTAAETEALTREFAGADEKFGPAFMQQSRERVLKMEALLRA